MNKEKRVVLLLAAYDFESLHLTLESLSHTLDQEEKVVIVLNGKRGIRSSIVEDVAREWCEGCDNRYVVKPYNYGLDAYTSISEVIEKFPVVSNAEFICKIDDDLIPLKKGWVDNLHQAYIDLEKKQRNIGFVTSLINNNAWGFKRLVELYKKGDEYQSIMNFESHSGTGVVEAGKMAEGRLGSVWQYPYLAKWIHGWTLGSIEAYITKTKDLGIDEVDINTHYSIGCIFIRKELWLSFPSLGLESKFDEYLIHEYCKKFNLKKFAVMNEPMGHLFYYNQRIANRLILPDIKKSLANYWNDKKFLQDFNFDSITNSEIVFENHLFENNDKINSISINLEQIKKNAVIYRLRTRYRSWRIKIFKIWSWGSKANHLDDSVERPAQLRQLKVEEKNLVKN